MMSMIQGVGRQAMRAMGCGLRDRRTMWEFLSTLRGFRYVGGDGLITDLMITMARSMTFQDIVDIVSSNRSPVMSIVHDTIVKFISERVLKGTGATVESMQHALKTIAADWFVQTVGIEHFVGVNLTSNYLGAPYRPSHCEGGHDLRPDYAQLPFCGVGGAGDDGVEGRQGAIRG